MLIQTNQHRSLCNSRKRHIPEAVEQQRTVREVQEQPEALRTDRERVVTVVLREVQGQREVQPEQVRGSGTSTGTGSGTTGSTGTTGNGTSTGDTSTGTGGESTGGEGTTE